MSKRVSFLAGYDECKKLVYTFASQDAGEVRQAEKDIINGNHAEAKEKGVFSLDIWPNLEPDRHKNVPQATKPKARRGRPPKAKEQTGDAPKPSAPAPVLPVEPEQIPPQAETDTEFNS